MKLSAAARYPASASQVAELLADRAFLDEWLAREATFSRSVSVAGAPPGPFTVSIRRRVPANDLPPQFRNLVPRGLDLRQVNVWDSARPDGERRGTVAVDIVGAPVKLVGTMALAPTGDNECDQRYAIDLAATIPLMGSRIEEAAAHFVKRSLATEETALLARLTTGPL